MPRAERPSGAPTKPDENRNSPRETQNVICIFPYTRAFLGDKDPNSDKRVVIEKDKTMVCKVRLSTVKKLGLEKFQTNPIYENKEGNLRVSRGAKGAKSWRFVFAGEGGKTNSYSFPVPGWCSIVDFMKGIYSHIPNNNRPTRVVSPHGVSYSVGLANIIEEKQKTPDDVELKENIGNDT
jgi:hypothetical protein